MKIIAIVDYEKSDKVVTKAIGRLSPTETLSQLWTHIEDQRASIDADYVLQIRLDFDL